MSSLETAVDVATKLFQSDRAEYADVLFTQRDLLEVETVLIDTKQQELSAIVNAYQALGGGLLLSNSPSFPAELFQQAIPVDPGPSLPPAEDDGGAPEADGASSGNDATGRATLASETTGSEVVPLFGDVPDVDRVFGSRVDLQRPARLEDEQVRELFESERLTGEIGQEALGTQPAGRLSVAAEEIEPRPMVTQGIAGQRETEDVEASPPGRTIIKAGAVAGGSLGLPSKRTVRPANEYRANAPAGE